jgi:MFS family permease
MANGVAINVIRPLVAKDSIYAWYVALLLSSAHLISFLDRFLMALVLVPVKEHLNLSDTQLGLLHGTGFVILYTVAALPLGFLADIGNRRNLIVAGILFWSLATAACGFSDSFAALFLARVGVGLGEAALVPAAMSLIAAYFSRQKISRAVATFTMGASLGKSVALIGGGAALTWLIATNGLHVPGFGTFLPWQGLFILGSLLGIIVAVLMLTVREPQRVADPRHGKPTVRAVFTYLRSQKTAFFWHTLASAGAILAVQSLAAWSPTFYVRMMGFTPAEAGFAVGTVVLLAGPLGHLSGGYLTDKFHSLGFAGAPGLVICLMMLASVIPAVLFCTTRDLTVSLVSFGILTFCVVAAAPPGLSGIQMMTPERLRGLMSACFLAVITFIAVGMGPTVIGIITDYVFGDEQALAQSLLVALLLFAALGATCGWISRGTAGAALRAAEA